MSYILITSHQSKFTGLFLIGEIGDFSKNVKLTHLILYNNNFTGNVNIDFHRSELKLKLLYFLGPVPDFSKHTALSNLDLSSNKLTGTSSLIATDQD